MQYKAIWPDDDGSEHGGRAEVQQPVMKPRANNMTIEGEIQAMGELADAAWGKGPTSPSTRRAARVLWFLAGPGLLILLLGGTAAFLTCSLVALVVRSVF